jgi:hypothetical protein
MKKTVRYLGVVFALLALASCSPFSEAQQSPELEFEIAMQVNSDGEFHVSLGVRNAGPRTFEGDNTFNGQMEVRHVPTDELRASAEVIPMQSIAPGETVWPMDWHAQLEPGRYEITWRAQEYGATTKAFTVVEEDGRLYLGGDGLLVVEPGDSPTPSKAVVPSEKQDALVGRAVSDLREHLGVQAAEVTVVSVEPTEFPDASLGVPEPGKSYAQMITPGFVIRLEANGEVYGYHAADERVVAVPPEDEEAPTGEPPEAYQTVNVPDLGLTFEVPAGWRQPEPRLAWTPEDGSVLRLGFNGVALEPPTEPEPALLPQLAQILESERVDLEWAEGRSFTLEVYRPAVEDGDTKAPVESVQEHVLVVLKRGEGLLGLDFYASAPDVEALSSLEPALRRMLDTVTLAEMEQSAILVVDEALTADWQLFEDGERGFRFKFPSDWASKQLQTQGPGVPGDWPVERSVIFFPQAWAERFEQSGAPDPEAPPAIAVVSLEVSVGPMDQFRRVYPEPVSVRTLEINGISAVREAEAPSDQAGMVRYVLEHPADSHVHIVLCDAINGFSDRVEAYPELAALIPQVVGTFEFVE